MRKQLWFHFLAVAAVLLTACSQAAAPLPTAGVPDAKAQPATQAVATQIPNAPQMACTIVSQQPTPGPTEVSMFPPVGEGDWVLGDNPNATMTIIEYSDFM